MKSPFLKMLEHAKYSEQFKKFFLLSFTKQLIKIAGAGDVYQLKRILENEKKEEDSEIKEKVHDVLNKKENKPFLKLKTLDKKAIEIKTSKPANPFKNIPKKRPVLRIPETRLPPQFSYLKPTPSNIEIDLGKLNPLLKDPLVKEIECNGPGDNIIVRGQMGTKPTAIILTKEEIRQVIDKFSQESKIPVQEGVYKVVLGKLILNSIVSDVLDSKFIIKKMMYQPGYR